MALPWPAEEKGGGYKIVLNFQGITWIPQTGGKKILKLRRRHLWMTLKDQAFFQILLVVVEIKNFSFLLLPLSFDPKESSKMDIIMLRMQIFQISLGGKDYKCFNAESSKDQQD